MPHSKSILRAGLDRRAALGLGLTGLMTAVAGLGTAEAQRPPSGPAEVPVADLMAAGPLPDVVVGKADAPVTIVEYASLTCPHCANFHNTVLPKLKEKYVETGKVRFIYRDFPIDNRAAVAAMLSRCAGPEKTAAVTAKLFATQEDWAFVQGAGAVPALFKQAEASGFTKETFDKCLADDKLLDNIARERERAATKFGVRSTPSFFINGKRFEGDNTKVEAFDAVIEPLLKS